jgi:hypothetical protein
MNRGEEEEEEYFSRFLSLSLSRFLRPMAERRKKKGDKLLSFFQHS